jgi:hypothetical protein
VARVGLLRRELPRSAHLSKEQVLTDMRGQWQRLAALVGNVDVGEIDAALRVDEWLRTRSPPKEEPSFASPQPVVDRGRLRAARFPWEEYLEGLGLSALETIRPTDAQTIALIDELAGLPLSDLKSFVRIEVMHSAVKLVTGDLREEEDRMDAMLDGRAHGRRVPLRRASTIRWPNSNLGWPDSFWRPLPPPRTKRRLARSSRPTGRASFGALNGLAGLTT